MDAVAPPGPADDGSTRARNPVDPDGQLARAVQELDQVRAELRAAELARDTAIAALSDQDARIARVEALCDLASWAAGEVDGDRSPPSVLVDDLRRAVKA